MAELAANIATITNELASLKSELTRTRTATAMRLAAMQAEMIELGGAVANLTAQGRTIRRAS
ncbi:hypothetical protein SAMN04515648_3456 [Phyllobacterium sp. CL33Tsu]|uniref:hypothetical protein n=1 Tax=Phyllobacterium sp. CL33Tsu TaxID=1798191 RepID=UPI0008F40651|nr:hypothetical protein [Phyllobacterium sp. CL33Tsu]SFJ31802.1 hypothetical protein SAMN04515648_3456 [Phyllobacterium sp. CL33Tsu]